MNKIKIAWIIIHFMDLMLLPPSPPPPHLCFIDPVLLLLSAPAAKSVDDLCDCILDDKSEEGGGVKIPGISLFLSS